MYYEGHYSGVSQLFGAERRSFSRLYTTQKVTPIGAEKSFSINRLRLSINQASLMFCIRLALLVSQARIIIKQLITTNNWQLTTNN